MRLTVGKFIAVAVRTAVDDFPDRVFIGLAIGVFRRQVLKAAGPCALPQRQRASLHAHAVLIEPDRHRIGGKPGGVLQIPSLFDGNAEPFRAGRAALTAIGNQEAARRRALDGYDVGIPTILQFTAVVIHDASDAFLHLITVSIAVYVVLFDILEYAPPSIALIEPEGSAFRLAALHVDADQNRLHLERLVRLPVLPHGYLQGVSARIDAVHCKVRAV